MTARPPIEENGRHGDFRPTDAWTLKFDAEFIHQDTVEQASVRVPDPVNGVVTLPRLPDPKRLLTGPWAHYVADARNLLLRSDYALSDAWIVTVEAGQAQTERPTRFFTQIENFDVVTGDGVARTFVQCCQDYTNSYGRVEALGIFETGAFAHELTIGYAMNRREQTSGATVQVLQPQNLYDPRELPEPTPTLPAPVGRGEIDDRGAYVQDRIEWRNGLATVGARRIDYSNVSPGKRFDARQTTPAASLTYRFSDDSNVYASYIEGFEEGGQAPLNAANALEVLPALKTRQSEIGAKRRFRNGTLVQASLFDIRRPSSGTDTTTRIFGVVGDARYRGLELSANGDLTRQWSLYASLQYLDAEITDAGNPALVGKTPENTPRRTASLWSEYRPRDYPGLGFGAGVFYVGERAVNALDQAFIDDFVRVDAGISYETKIGGRKVLLRALLENAFDRNYWVAAGNNLLAQGLPRTLRLNARTRQRTRAPR